ncbi:M949_RS01915 family surface polysaccharide biosynthesis protein [Chitinophaga caseinilytica]|uniref:Uncharacterized protein n=2 Tax=Chitinophaga caseinilytica TaxID=2267521 RepID=A0ABZ2Z413_9BACT
MQQISYFRRMRRFITSILLFLPAFAFAQEVKIIPRAEIDAEYETKFPVFRGFSYVDNSGSWKILLCENQDKITAKDTVNTALQAVCLLEDHGGYLEKWTLNDFIEKEMEESHIWFTTSYCSFRDLDADGRIDPIIVYMTKDGNGIRRVKVFVVYKNEKFAVRAVENEFDNGRSLRYAPGFDKLPAPIRSTVETLLQRMRKDRGLLLKNG